MSLPNRSFPRGSLNSSSVEWRVPLSDICFTSEEERAIADVVRSGWWTYGPVARKLEEEYAATLGIENAVAVASGTAALHLAFLALGMSPGDEVLTPSLNFVAAANMIVHSGGVPRFVDVESVQSPLAAVKNFERSLSDKTRGICVMHYGGYPGEMDAVMEFARRHGLWVVEDAAHALGSYWKDVPCGSWGDVGCFSFFGNKNITSGEGGFAVTKRADLADKLRSLRSHGMDSLTWDRYRGHQFSYDVTTAGFNYRLDDLRAAVLRVQLRSLEAVNRLRRERVSWYQNLLGSDSRWSIPFQGYPGISSGHLFVVVLAEGISRSRVMSHLKNRGIQSSIHYPPVHLFQFYRNLLPLPADLRITEALGRRLVTLPLYPGLQRGQVQLVSETFKEAVDLASAEVA